MTLMLASVSSPDEARLAVTAGADVIDLKDPARGALGALPTAVIAECVQAVAGRRPVSATIGDLDAVPGPVLAAAREVAASGVDAVKIGLFAGDDARAFLAALRGLELGGAAAVLVMFADRAPDLGLLPAVAAAGFAGVMLDTADKRRGGLRACLDRATLAAFVRGARRAGLLAGLAGSLSRDDIARLLPLAPDLLGFRTALCAGGARAAPLDRDAVAGVRAAIPTAADQALLHRATRLARSA